MRGDGVSVGDGLSAPAVLVSREGVWAGARKRGVSTRYDIRVGLPVLNRCSSLSASLLQARTWENKTKHLQNIPRAYQSHNHTGARCSSVVRAFTHGAMGRRIDPSWVEPIELFLVPASAPRLV